MAALAPQPVAGAQGAGVVNADGAAIADQIIKRMGRGGLASTLITGPLGSLGGWLHAEPNGLRGHLKLNVK
jgi:hypothetical protein